MVNLVEDNVQSGDGNPINFFDSFSCDYFLRGFASCGFIVDERSTLVSSSLVS